MLCYVEFCYDDMIWYVMLCSAHFPQFPLEEGHLDVLRKNTMKNSKEDFLAHWSQIFTNAIGNNGKKAD